MSEEIKGNKTEKYFDFKDFVIEMKWLNIISYLFHNNKFWAFV